MMRYLCAVIVCLALGVVASQAKDVELLDLDVNSDVAVIAQHVCQTVSGRTKQIARASTIARLLDHFERVPSSCAQRHLQSLEDLKAVLTTSNQNVCSDQKLALIESFHRNYVSTASEDRTARTGERAPKILELFFMHYAMEVSAVCKRSLIDGLQTTIPQRFSAQDYQEGNLDQMIEVMRRFFGSAKTIERYDGSVLLWDLFGSMRSANDDATKLLEEIGIDFQAQTKLRLRSKDAHLVGRLQQQCRQSFRPFYSQLVLPVVRLAGLGYAFSDKQMRSGRRSLDRELVRKWYGIAQGCETLLPIEVYQDDELPPGKVIIIGKEEAEALGEPEGSEATQAVESFEPSGNSMASVDLLDSVKTSEAQRLVKSVKSNISFNDRARKAIAKRVRSHLKAYVKAAASSLFISRKQDGRFVAQDVKQSIDETLVSAEQQEALSQEGAGVFLHSEDLMRIIKLGPLWVTAVENLGKSFFNSSMSVKQEFKHLLGTSFCVALGVIFFPILFANWLLGLPFRFIKGVFKKIFSRG